MTRIIESRRRFKSRLDAKQDVSRPIPALMGDGAGVIDVPNQPGYVYIRVGDGDLGQAFNNRVPRADNLAIDVGYDPVTDPDRRIFQVLSVRMADYAGGGNTIYPNTPNHHESHEFGGGDDVFLSWRRLMGLRVGRPSGFSVTVDEGFILRAGAWLAVLAQTLDLTASKPALATQARYVLIALNAAGVATATNGALVAVGALDISDCPIPAAGEIPLAAIRMYGTQTSIGDVPSAPDIIDLRFPQAASTGSVYLADLEKGTAQYQIITSGANPYPATWSGFYVRGTAGGTTNLAVTNTKTLTLTSADDYNLTAERTGAVIVRTSGGAPAPQIVGDAVGAGNARGQRAVDLQLSRINAISVASGNYASILGGSDNQASGNYSVVVGGSGNAASGINSFVGGGLNAVAAGDYSYASGANCQALGNYSYAVGRSARTGANAGVFIWGDSTNANFNGIIADEFALRARGGFRHAYDDSNYWTAQVSAAGAVTFDAVGASAGFTFSDAVALSSLTASTAIYADASKVLVSLANAAGYFTNNGAGVFSWSATATPAAHNVLDSTYHGDVLTGAITRGDLLYGNATPKIARLALGGAAGSFLTRDATDVVWSGFYLAGTAAQTYTFPAAGGTVALLNAANAFTALNTFASNVGIGTVDIEAWHASYRAIESYQSAIMFGVANNLLDIMSNAYYDGAFKYKANGFATLYQSLTGGHTFKVAASGLADAAITFIDALAIGATGGVHVGGTSDPGDNNLLVDGTLASASATHTVADAAVGLRVAGATGKLRVIGYQDATYGVFIDAVNAAEGAYIPLSLYTTGPVLIPGGRAACWRHV